MRHRTIAFLLFALLLAQAQDYPPPVPLRIKVPKKEKEPETQTLPLPVEPPPAVIAETARLEFHVSPLSGKGLLTQQVHDALKALQRANGGGTFVKLRAFVAGTGDMRRVATIVSEELTDRKMPLPAITTIQVGALPMEGAQVVIESISSGKKAVNPNGLVFFSAQPAAELAASAKAQDAVLLQVTCFAADVNRPDGAGAFPGAAVNFVQLTRLPVDRETSCEGVGRLQKPGKSPSKLVFTGIQMAFGDQEPDLRLAYGRLGKVLESMKVGYGDSAVLNIYALSRAGAEKAGALSASFLDPQHRNVYATKIVEGLPSLDATVAVDLIASVP